MFECKPTQTPAETMVKLMKPAEENEWDKNNNVSIPYREAVGCMMYLMLCTRPDIAAAITKVAQFASNYDGTHWTVVKWIYRYIKGTLHYVLALGNVSKMNSQGITL